MSPSVWGLAMRPRQKLERPDAGNEIHQKADVALPENWLYRLILFQAEGGIHLDCVDGQWKSYPGLARVYYFAGLNQPYAIL